MLTVCESWVNAFWKGRNLLTNVSKITASLKYLLVKSSYHVKEYNTGNDVSVKTVCNLVYYTKTNTLIYFSVVTNKRPVSLMTF